MKLNKRNSLLIISLIALVFSIGYYFVFDTNAKLAYKERYLANVQKNIHTSLVAANSELSELEVQLASVSSSIKMSQFPYFIYKEGKLVAWSDKAFVPEYEQVANWTGTRLLTTDNHFIIAVKKKISNGYELIVAIPLYQHFPISNDFLKNEYNSAIFDTQPNALSIGPSSGKGMIVDIQNKTLFYVEPPAFTQSLLTPFPHRTFVLLVVTMLLGSLYIFFQLKHWMTQHLYGRSFILFAFYCVLIRLLIYISPFKILHTTLNNPSWFPNNPWGFTVGDKIYNQLLFITLLGYLSIYIYRSKIFYSLLKSSAIKKSIVSVVGFVVMMLTGFWAYQQLSAIFTDSNYLLSYGFDVAVSPERLLIWVYYILLSITCFLLFHISLYLFTRIHVNKRTGLYHWLYGLLLSLIVMVLIDELRVIYLILGLVFLWAYYVNLSRYYYIFRFKTSIYFFLFAFYFSVFGVSVLMSQEKEKAILEMRQYAQTLLSNQSQLQVQQFERTSQKIAKDPKIAQLVQSPTLARERVVQYLSEYYLQDYFGKYAAAIDVFDAAGNNLDILDENDSFEQRFLSEPEAGVSLLENKNYRIYSPIMDKATPEKRVGSVVIELSAIQSQQEGLPEQLVHKQYEQKITSQNYSYTVFDAQGKRLTQSGKPTFSVEWLDDNFQNPLLYSEGIYDQTYLHWGFIRNGTNKQIVVISNKHQLLEHILSNLSFLFSISIFSFTIALILYGVRYGAARHIRLDFSTRLQLYLNAALLIPLLLVVIITMGVVRSTLLTSQEKTITATSNNILSTLKLLLNELEEGRMSEAYFKQEVTKVAQTTKNDITIYDRNGRMSYTTRPMLYSFKITSPYIQPSALLNIRQLDQSEWVQEESIGSLLYKVSYNPLSTANASHAFNILSVPFFDSNLTFNRQLNQVIATILSSFILLFVILLVVSYFVSRQLTYPLRVITQKIKKTNLNKLNEPLDWESDDEIGVLMRSYNKMLRKLEENKLALSISEKQTAWREMAKQVAHEIKNPLTPMKLSIQQLQRTLPAENTQSRQRIERALNSLTEQIDNISEIANSFSEFAKMPVPRIESYDIVPVIQKTVDLYAENKNVDISFVSIKNSIKVMGDRQLMSRIVNNLIINGLQSIPTNKKPQIQIKLYKNEEKNFAIFEVKDNGVGIPESIRKKVFIPNFSTKVGGSGLGLAMAKRGIEHVGGNIWFDTVEGIGTIFYVDIPLDITEKEQ